VDSCQHNVAHPLVADLGDGVKMWRWCRICLKCRSGNQIVGGPIVLGSGEKPVFFLA